jgi:GNAT superfamily N-acetyltransferase
MEVVVRMVEVLPATAGRYAHLSVSDLDAIYALHLKATGAVGRSDLIKPETRDFFERILNGGGRIVGVKRDDELVAYGVLQLELPPSEDARPVLGLAPADRLAKLAGASVLPEIWGGGIHDVLIGERVEQARRLGVTHLYSTSAPGNARSWENLLGAGFAVRAVIEKYGGHARFILHRDLAAAEPAMGEGIWCSASDIERQRELLAAACIGTHWRKLDDGSRELWYRGSA